MGQAGSTLIGHVPVVVYAKSPADGSEVPVGEIRFPVYGRLVPDADGLRVKVEVGSIIDGQA